MDAAAHCLRGSGAGVSGTVGMGRILAKSQPFAAASLIQATAAGSPVCYVSGRSTAPCSFGEHDTDDGRGHGSGSAT
jgi:hypothetical protein